MELKLLHVYRNTPLGRETLLQSAWFCRQTGCRLEVYVPRHPQFLMYFAHGVATVTLDSSYLRDGGTAEERARAIVSELGPAPRFVEPADFTAPTLPSLRSDYDFMACPRSMSELSSKIGFGHLGPRVRAIVNGAPFPVLLPTPVYKPWTSVVVGYGGSESAVRALLRARLLCDEAGLPLSLFTWAEGKERAEYEGPLERTGLLPAVRAGKVGWLFVESATLEEGLFEIPRDALVVLGAYGHGAVRDAFFGSKPETIQTEVPNNLLLFGPNVRQALSG